MSVSGPWSGLTTSDRAEVPGRPAAAWWGLLVLGGSLAGLLLAFAGRYGYHRDELYFVRAGAEPAFGYADQPPLTPLLAHGLHTLTDGSLVALRTPSALIAGVVVVLTGLLAREFGASRAAQVLAAACMSVAAVLLVAGHMLSTATVDLLVWTSLSWLVVRALRDDGAVWLAVGAVAGVGLQNKALPALLVAALLLGMLLAGPRIVLRSTWLWLGALLAVAVWTPHLAWQVANGFPQLALSSAIAAGGSGTSEPWYLFLPFQLVLVSPALVPVWAVGWWRLATSPELRPWRAFAVAYVALALFFMVAQGKPYYLAGMYPVLLAAGAAPVLAWARQEAERTRSLVVALTVSLAAAAVLMLPVLPARWLASTPVLHVNYDAGETVGWPQLAHVVAEARDTLPPEETVVVLTENYGQAGAVDRFLPELAPAFSGHNAYWTWGPPPDEATSLVVVGWTEVELRRWFAVVRLAARIDNGVDLPNDEQGTPVWLVSERAEPWSTVWPQLRHLG